MESKSSSKDREKPTEADAAAAVERQPDEFPVDFDGWAATKAAAWQVLVHGFRHELRLHGGLLAKKLAMAWESEFTAFCNRPPKPAPAKR